MLTWFARSVREEYTLPRIAKAERRLDRHGLGTDPGIESSVAESMHWLCRSQDHSASADGGSARHYSLVTGKWSPSYPETTGYIVPTMLQYAARTGEESYRERARTMLNWLTSIQMRDGAFQGGMIHQKPVVPVTFNTGQILMGLAAGVQEFGKEYLDATHAAAGWLVKTQDTDGAWHTNHSPHTTAEDKVYNTHTAWGLLEAGRATNTESYCEAAYRNIEWALKHQHKNGWFDHCDLNDSTQPLTHTIGYTLRGILELYMYAKEPTFLTAAQRTADALLATMSYDGSIPGRFDKAWKGTVSWVCLTGSVQIAHSWLVLYDLTKDARYLSAGRLANQYVRRTVRFDVPLSQRGGIKGSFPVSGDYGRFEYLNWASKFFVDSNLLEADVLKNANGGRQTEAVPVQEATQVA